jgi:hypothetical protein
MKHTFILSDDSVNKYGFRVLTAGIDLSQFKKNPIMLYAHIRAYENKGKDGVILPIGTWENVRKQDGKLVADAVFDEDDEFAVKVAKKVEKKMLNTASISFDDLVISEDPKDYLKGQTGPTIRKCVLNEASIADIPGNANAVRLHGKDVTVRLGMSDSNPEDLQKLFAPKPDNKPNKHNMKFLISLLNTHKGIQLSADASEAQVEAAAKQIVDELKAKEQEVTQLTAKKTELEQEIANAKAKALTDKATALIDQAVTDKKILAGEKEAYQKLAATEEGFDNVKSILDAKKGYTPVKDKLKDEGDKPKHELVAEFDLAFQEGTLEEIEKNDPDRYALLFKAKFGKEPA